VTEAGGGPLAAEDPPGAREALGGGLGRSVGDEALQEALGRAYRYMAQRDRSIAEIRRHLTRLDIADALIDACVDELCHLGYLNDARFAERFSADRRTLDGWGNKRICTRLRALGVPEDLCEEAAGRDPDGELDAALAELHRRVRQAPTGPRERQKALGMLVRRGFELELAHDAVRRFEAEAA
jgi:regulatory protein